MKAAIMKDYKKLELMEKHIINDIDADMAKTYGRKYTEYRELFHRRPVPVLELPMQLDMDLVDACNLKCSMCHQSYRSRTGEKLDKNIMEKAIRESLPVLACVNFGASCEPLLAKDLLYHGLDLLNQYDVMDSFLHTNGILLDGECSEILLDKGLKHLCVSLDAASPEMYQKMRKSDKYDVIVNNIHEFLTIRGNSIYPQLRLSFCSTNINRHEKGKFLEQWQNIADIIDFQDFHYMDGVDETLKKEREGASQGLTCDAGKLRGMLCPDGTVSACCTAWNAVALGNITGQSMREIWNSERANSIRELLGSQDQQRFPKLCRMCQDI